MRNGVTIILKRAKNISGIISVPMDASCVCRRVSGHITLNALKRPTATTRQRRTGLASKTSMRAVTAMAVRMTRIDFGDPRFY